MARKIEFDRDNALKQSMMLFWEKGYENTSMQDLVTTLAINRFSIYNTFGDKKALFQQSLQYYRTHVFERLNQPLRNNEISGKKRIDNYLENFGKHISSRKGNLGCMIQTSTLSEISEENEIQHEISEAFYSLQAILQKTLQQSKEQNEFNSNCEVETAAMHIICSLQGLIVLRKSQKDSQVISAQIDFLRKTVRNW